MGPSRNDHGLVARVLGAQAQERLALPPQVQDAVLLGREVGLRGKRTKARPGLGARLDGRHEGPRIAERRSPDQAVRAAACGPSRYDTPAMQTPNEAPQARHSAFAAAFFSFLLPGLGQVYAGRWRRGAFFMVPWLLAVALIAGTAFSMGLKEFGQPVRLTPPGSSTCSRASPSTCSGGCSPSSTRSGSRARRSGVHDAPLRGSGRRSGCWPSWPCCSAATPPSPTPTYGQYDAIAAPPITGCDDDHDRPDRRSGSTRTQSFIAASLPPTLPPAVASRPARPPTPRAEPEPTPDAAGRLDQGPPQHAAGGHQRRPHGHAHRGQHRPRHQAGRVHRHPPGHRRAWPSQEPRQGRPVLRRRRLPGARQPDRVLRRLARIREPVPGQERPRARLRRPQGDRRRDAGHRHPLLRPGGHGRLPGCHRHPRRRVVDVQLPVYDSRYAHDDGRGAIKLYIPPGIHSMDGAEALAYSRSRHASSDFDRSARQMRIITASGTRSTSPACSGDIGPAAGHHQEGHPDRHPVQAAAHAGPARPGHRPGQAHLAPADPAQLQHAVPASCRLRTRCASRTASMPWCANVPAMRKAVRNVFTTDPKTIERQQTLDSEGAVVHVLNGTKGTNSRPPTSRTAWPSWAWTAPCRPSTPARPTATTTRTRSSPPTTARRTSMPETIKLLEDQFGVSASPRTTRPRPPTSWSSWASRPTSMKPPPAAATCTASAGRGRVGRGAVRSRRAASRAGLSRPASASRSRPRSCRAPHRSRRG